MPAPLRVDWTIPKQLFVNGLALTDVARQTQIPYVTLKQHARRHKWKDSIQAHAIAVAKAVAKATQDTIERDTRDTLKQGNQWRSRIVKLTERHLTAVEGKDPETLKLSDFETLARITDTTDRIARRSFGLDVAAGGNQTTNVMVHLEASSNPATAPLQLEERNQGPAIDVESTPAGETKQDTSAPETAK